MLNRFVKMVVLQYARALMLGYSDKIARAIGYAVAQKYAIFKNLPKKKDNKNSKNIKSAKKRRFYIEQKENENIIYGKDEIFKITIDFDNYPVIKTTKITEDDFNRYMSRFDQETLNKLAKWASEIIRNCDEKVLKNENKFFNEIWKKHRDDEI